MSTLPAPPLQMDQHPPELTLRGFHFPSVASRAWESFSLGIVHSPQKQFGSMRGESAFRDAREECRISGNTGFLNPPGESGSRGVRGGLLTRNFALGKNRTF